MGYVTITEFARRAGVTRPTVYRHLNGKLAGYTVKQDDVTMIDVKALELYRNDPAGIQDEQQATDPACTEGAGASQGDYRDVLIKSLQAEVELLGKELEEKNRQLEEQGKLLSQLNDTVRIQTDIMANIFKQGQAQEQPVLEVITPACDIQQGSSAPDQEQDDSADLQKSVPEQAPGPAEQAPKKGFLGRIRTLFRS